MTKENLDENISDEDTIFHYTSLQTAIEHIIPNQQLKLTPFNNMSDPYESNSNFELTYKDGMGDDVFRNNVNEAYNLEEKIKFGFRIACFCTNKKPDCFKEDEEVADNALKILGYQRPRMWAQYADHHKGVCLVFSRKELEKELKEKRVYSDIFFGDVQYYKYLENPIIRLDQINGSIETYFKVFIEKNNKRLFFSKYIDYRDEAEFRIGVYSSKSVDVCINISKAIKGVIIGDKTHQVYNDLIHNLCQKKEIDCKGIKWSNGEGELVNIEVEK